MTSQQDIQQDDIAAPATRWLSSRPMRLPDPIAWTPAGHIRLLDQTLLPGEERYLVLDSVDSVAEAIQALRVRGAPLIGIAAAMGVALAASGGREAVR